MVTSTYIRATRSRELPGFDSTQGRLAPDVVYYALTQPAVIKIGTTSNLPQRVRSLRLTMEDVLATEPGGYPLERLRHAQFEAERIVARREDFRASDALLSHVEMLRSHVR